MITITHRFLRLHVTERRHLIINRVGFAKIMMTLKLLIVHRLQFWKIQGTTG